MILRGEFDGARILEASSIEDILGQPDTGPPDIVLLDIRLRGLSGMESIGLFRRRWPCVPIIMISSETSSSLVQQALDRGAQGFVSKAEEASRIIGAIRSALGMAGRVPSGPLRAGDHPRRLTSRQCEVLHFLAQGLSNKVIARQLGLSENTVRGHVQSIMLQLDATSRAQAAYRARQLGLVH